MKLSKCLKRKLANSAYNIFVSKDNIIKMICFYQDKTAHLLCDESNRQGKFNSIIICNSNSYCVKAVPLNHSNAYVKFILIQLEEKLNLSCLLRMVNENDAVTVKHVKLAQQIHDKDEKTWYTSRCFIRTATTTFTRTNCAIRTNTTKKTGAMNELTQQLVRHFSEASQSSRSVS